MGGGGEKARFETLNPGNKMVGKVGEGNCLTKGTWKGLVGDASSERKKTFPACSSFLITVIR